MQCTGVDSVRWFIHADTHKCQSSPVSYALFRMWAEMMKVTRGQRSKVRGQLGFHGSNIAGNDPNDPRSQGQEFDLYLCLELSGGEGVLGM